ncbi:hypothetical protein [Haladaptatus sp. W1]|uniref:hypothetical protein n=1 Tax=Haladaptatus sp. W1 TaxID=1897478 RepID=UPI0009F32591|nr:hypothetical protein [Haladaptatus sp. W1]
MEDLNDEYRLHWDYQDGDFIGNPQSDASHYAKWEYEVPEDGNYYRHTFTSQAGIPGDGGAGNLTLQWIIDVASPTGGGGGGGEIEQVDGSRQIEQLDALPKKDKRKYGLRKVPLSALEESGIDVDKVPVDEDNMTRVSFNPPMSVTVEFDE